MNISMKVCRLYGRHTSSVSRQTKDWKPLIWKITMPIFTKENA